jgi:nicotinamidase-related amidase
MSLLTMPARPAAIEFDTTHTALIIIDMQRDFVDAGGFGESLGNDVSLLRQAIDPARQLLQWARANDLLVIHTREGHRPDLSDVPPVKLRRGKPLLRIGDKGPMGRILIRGEYGHDIITELAPLPHEPVVDKPGKGAFYQTDLELLLARRHITTLLVCGVTTEVCVHTTVREANDRGFCCVVMADACASYFPEFHAAAIEMICAQGGIFGWVARVESLPVSTSFTALGK